MAIPFWDVTRSYSCRDGRATAVLQKTNIPWIINHSIESTPADCLLAVVFSLRVNSIFPVSTAAWWRGQAMWQVLNGQKQTPRYSHMLRMIPPVYFLLFLCAPSLFWEETIYRDEMLNMPILSCLVARKCWDISVLQVGNLILVFPCYSWPGLELI